ncbi:hypothetical protein I6F09_36700 [Bradyrhizobium sp. IC3195]|uniref:hypothetical protein n=1 Tax=Bradyrhizobium sp. IC3195 TaxID=2793804 RepID=UPI001CD48261|nr:hypothetical protein [Bradyrhizobium sp. IC3195]MCA1473354.1 hypothetical protein [Bradyrhizobium sp. IC3195]
MTTYDAKASCFGKLPFQLMDSLQLESSVGSNYWADAVLVPSSNEALATIDCVSLDDENLALSVQLAILHSMNDIFAANGIPTSFCISLILSSSTGADLLSQLNQTIVDCAKLIDCSVGKRHTVRAEGPASATVSVIGKVANASSNLEEGGFVVLVGGSLGALDSTNEVTALHEVQARQYAAREIPGPKKDVSGDGLVGTLYQLMLRHSVSIEIASRSIPRFASSGTIASNELHSRNYFDYSSKVLGELSPNCSATLFAPRLFGPIVCLTAGPLEFPDMGITTIGSFRRGKDNHSLRLS